jgi:hypothetical protein
MRSVYKNINNTKKVVMGEDRYYLLNINGYFLLVHRNKQNT